jgi:hypothetical protein
MKYSLFFVLFLFTGILYLNAQTPTPHYVVIDDAQAEISLLESRNQEMSSANSLLENENRKLEEEIVLSEEFIVLADEMIDRLSGSAGEIYTLMQTINDADTRRELQNRMDENRQSRYDLENRKRRENETITRARDRIEDNRKLIAVNRVRSKANDQRSEYLQACIDLSVNENRDVDSILDNADQVRQEVERLLSR